MSFLRSRGADFNARTSVCSFLYLFASFLNESLQAGYTVLHLAAIRNDKHMAKMLAENYGKKKPRLNSRN